MRTIEKVGLVYAGLIAAHAIFGAIVPAIFLVIVLSPFLLIGFVLYGLGHIFRR
jgi:hypothetical protein